MEQRKAQTLTACRLCRLLTGLKRGMKRSIPLHWRRSPRPHMFGLAVTVSLTMARRASDYHHLQLSPEGVEATAQGNALCFYEALVFQALKGRKQLQPGLCGPLRKLCGPLRNNSSPQPFNFSTFLRTLITQIKDKRHKIKVRLMFVFMRHD